MSDAERRDMAQWLYRALLVMPCACCHKWDKGKSMLTSECRRCRVCREYEESLKEMKSA